MSKLLLGYANYSRTFIFKLIDIITTKLNNTNRDVK